MSRKDIQAAIKTLGKAMNQLNKLVEDDQERLGDVDTLKHSRQFSDEENMGLPLPRMELRTYELGRGERLCVKYLVTRHYSGHIQANAQSWTNISGGNPAKRGEPEDPFRDGANIRYDAVTLKLPAYAVHENGTIVEMTSFREYFGGPTDLPPKYIGEK